MEMEQWIESEQLDKLINEGSQAKGIKGRKLERERENKIDKRHERILDPSRQNEKRLLLFRREKMKKNKE